MTATRRSVFGGMVAVFGLALAGVGAAAWWAAGALVYAIDDPYIHLTLARNLAADGTFGIVPGHYESASSGPLWELALAPVLRLAPSATWWPLVVDVAAALVLLWLVSGIPAVVRLSATPLGRVGVWLLPVSLGLAPLVATGMEHIAHAAVAAAVVILLYRMLRDEAGRADLIWFYALLAAGVLLRFETLFLGAGAALALLLVPGPSGRRRWARAAGAVAAPVLPALGFAAVNTALGQYPLPNSVAAKTRVGSGIPLPRPAEVADRALSDPLLLLLAVLFVWAWVRLRRRDQATEAALVVAAAVPLGLQVVFADVGWFDRYQAWLVALGATTLLLVLPALGPWDRIVRPASLVLVLAVAPRLALLVNTPVAIANVHQNQQQLGTFLARYHQGEGVVVNDIGWVGWLHEGPLVDVAGLGSSDMLRAAKEGRLDRATVADAARRDGAHVMAVYDDVFGGLVPEGWQRAGRWCVTGRVYVLSSRCVGFYAPAGADAERLARELREFAPSLPEGVELQSP